MTEFLASLPPLPTSHKLSIETNSNPNSPSSSPSPSPRGQLALSKPPAKPQASNASPKLQPGGPKPSAQHPNQAVAKLGPNQAPAKNSPVPNNRAIASPATQRQATSPNPSPGPNPTPSPNQPQLVRTTSVVQAGPSRVPAIIKPNVATSDAQISPRGKAGPIGQKPESPRGSLAAKPVASSNKLLDNQVGRVRSSHLSTPPLRIFFYYCNNFGSIFSLTNLSRRLY